MLGYDFVPIVHYIGYCWISGKERFILQYKTIHESSADEVALPTKYDIEFCKAKITIIINFNDNIIGIEVLWYSQSLYHTSRKRFGGGFYTLVSFPLLDRLLCPKWRNERLREGMDSITKCALHACVPYLFDPPLFPIRLDSVLRPRSKASSSFSAMNTIKASYFTSFLWWHTIKKS